MSKSALLSVELPKNMKPSFEANEYLIKKFLKECSKDSLLYYLSENSAMSRRFTKKSVKMRQKKLNRLRNAKKHQQEVDRDFLDDKKKKKKQDYSSKKNNE